MKPFFALLYKEWLHHRIIFIILSVFLFFSLGILIINALNAARSLSVIEAGRNFLTFFIPLSAIFLGNRIVVKEYLGRTQLFIEALPIPRTAMVLLKYFIGFFLLLMASLLTITIVSLLALKSEPVGFRFLGILLLRATMFVYFIWGFFFCMGFIGRFRIPIYITMIICISVISSTTEFEFSRFGPVALIHPDTFSFERDTFPVTELLQTFYLGFACFVLSLSLALLKEGSVAESLARKMTQKEKVTVCVLILGLILALDILELKKKKAPYQFSSNKVVASAIEPVEILYIQTDVEEDARVLLKHLEKVISGLKKSLVLKNMPPIRIAYRQTLDRQTFETAVLNDTDGILVRANFKDIETFEIKSFTAYMIRSVLDQTTIKRSRFESKRWFHDGFSSWYAEYTSNLNQEINEKLLLRSIFVTSKDTLSANAIKKWTLFREKHGEALAVSLAYTGIAYLHEIKGKETVLNLARTVLGRTPPKDFRETVYELNHPMAEVFQTATGEPWDDFLSGWNDWLIKKATEEKRKRKINSLQNAKSFVRMENKNGNVSNIFYRIDFNHHVKTKIVCVLLHKKLPPFDAEIDKELLMREEYIHDPALESEEKNLSGRYNSGERIFLALEYESDPLGCPVRIYTKRINLP